MVGYWAVLCILEHQTAANYPTPVVPSLFYSSADPTTHPYPIPQTLFLGLICESQTSLTVVISYPHGVYLLIRQSGLLFPCPHIPRPHSQLGPGLAFQDQKASGYHFLKDSISSKFSWNLESLRTFTWSGMSLPVPWDKQWSWNVSQILVKFRAGERACETDCFLPYQQTRVSRLSASAAVQCGPKGNWGRRRTPAV